VLAVRRIGGHVRSNAVGYLALFVALGGSAYAASRLPANSVGTKQLQNGAVTGQKVARQTLTGNNINLSQLGTVPNASHANNADELGAQPPSAFTVHCPTGMFQSGGDCIDFQARGPSLLQSALSTCARAGLHLADAGELAQLFDRVGPSQPAEWTGATNFDPSADTEIGATLANDSNRNIIVGALNLQQNEDFRCATSATN
jgi:hypothetical protein